MSERKNDCNKSRRLLKVSEVADRLGLSQRKIWSLASEGALPKVRIGAAVRFDPRDVDALIEQSREVVSNG